MMLCVYYYGKGVIDRIVLGIKIFVGKIMVYIVGVWVVWCRVEFDLLVL